MMALCEWALTTATATTATYCDKDCGGPEFLAVLGLIVRPSFFAWIG